jgi:hypothetical protein
MERGSVLSAARVKNMRRQSTIRKFARMLLFLKKSRFLAGISPFPAYN